jgi:hypothetical protein
MAIIIDPDNLNQGIEITINTTTKEITLIVAGNLSNDGVTGQALYSFLKEEWRADATKIPFDFPMVGITPEQFEFVAGWVLVNDTSRNLIRAAGWREIDAGQSVNREYMGVVSLGNIGLADLAHYAFASQTSKTDFAFNGVVNQGVQTFGDAANGNFDYRGQTLTLYIRTQGKQYGTQTTTDIGVSGLSYIAYRFPLSESNDIKITTTDSDISTLAPYNGMSITYGAVTRTIGAGTFDYAIVIDGNNATAEQIYEFVQYQLRQDADIDDGAGTDNGLLAESLLEFVGDSLSTLSTSLGGVYIDNFNTNDTNRITFKDDLGIGRTFPFVAAGSILPNINLQADASSIYRMFFTTNPAGDFGTVNAVLVDNNASVDISGNIAGRAEIPFDYDYDGNVQGGRTAATDADVTIVAIGLNSAQYVVATGTITRATGVNFSLVAPLERNYTNPA